MTPASILVCDACHCPIANIDRAMIFWQADADRRVTSLRLAHKGRSCDASNLDLSAELWWLATPRSALRRLTELAYDYRWTVEQLQRLTFIAWAIATQASPASRKRAHEWHDERMEMGL